MTEHWRDVLTGLVEQTADRQVAPRSWDVVVEDAHTTVLAVQGVAALGRTRADSIGGQYGTDAVLLGLDALRTPTRIEDTQARDAIITALERFGPNKYDASDLDAILDRIAQMSSAQLRGLMNGVQGTLFELEVGQAFADEAIPLPDGAAGGVVLDRNAPQLDGYFYDEQNLATEPFQIKATESLDYVRQHLADNPDVDHLILTSEVAAEAEGAGLDNVLDIGTELRGLLPRREESFRQLLADGSLETAAEASAADLFPLITLAVASGQVAWSWARGGDLDDEVGRLLPRATRATAIHALAYGASYATGFEPARLALIVGGQTVAATVGRVDRELAASIDHVRGCRRILDDLVAKGEGEVA